MYKNTKIGKQLEKLSPEKQVDALAYTLQHLGIHHHLDAETTRDVAQYLGVKTRRGGHRRRKSGKRKTQSHRKQ
jgi:hypothetical protein